MTAHGEALRDPDHQLRIRAIDTLAAIPHVEAVRALIPLLGDSTAADDGFVRDRIAAALRTRGEAKLVDMISYVFAGRMTALKRYEGEHLPQVIEALVEALEGYFTGTNAARALAEVHAEEPLPRLRKVLRRVGTRDPIGQAVADAIE